MARVLAGLPEGFDMFSTKFARALGDEGFERLPRSILGRATEHALGGAVEDGYVLLRVGVDDGVNRRFDDAVEQSATVAQCRISAFSTDASGGS